MGVRIENESEVRSATTARGEVRGIALTPNLTWIVMKGRMEEGASDFLVRYMDERIRHSVGGAYFFHDWLDMTGYESVCRQRLTEWTAENRSSITELHLAVQSKIVAMGVQVANLALGGFLRTHTDRASLDREIERIRRATGGR